MDIKHVGTPNLQRMYNTLAAILSKKYGVEIAVTVKEKKDD